MHFTLRHLRAFHLSIIATALPIASSTTCFNSHSGRLPLDGCIGYVDCMNGVEIDRAKCQDGMLYSESTENCEVADSVTVCNTLLKATIPATTTDAPVLVDDSGMWIQDNIHTSSTQPQVVHDGNDAVGVFSTAAAVETTQKTPDIADDGGTWVPDDTQTSSTPQIVFDGPDAVAPSTTVPSDNVVTTTPVVVRDGTDATAIWSTTDPSSTQSAIHGFYTPNRSDKTCTPVDGHNRKRNLRRLPSIWHGVYPTKDECCGVYSSNDKHYDTCINN